MKELRMAAGCKTRIIHRQFSSLVTTYTFDAAPAIEGGYLAGTVEIRGSSWIFPKSATQMPLQSQNTVTAGYWDTFFAVYVIPEVDVVITLPSKSFGSWLWLILLMAVVVGGAIVLVLLTTG